MAKDKEEKGFFDRIRSSKLVKALIISAGVTAASLGTTEQAEAAETTFSNGNQTKITQMQTANVKEKIISLSVKRAVKNAEVVAKNINAIRTHTAGAKYAKSDEFKAQHKAALEELQAKMKAELAPFDEQISDLLNANPNLKDKINLDAQVRKTENPRILAVVFGNNVIRMYDKVTDKVYSDPITMQKDLEKGNQTFGNNTKTQQQTRTQSGQER